MTHNQDYVTCPRCEGQQQVYAYTKIPNGYGSMAEGEYFTCPRCCGAGDIHKDDLEEDDE